MTQFQVTKEQFIELVDQMWSGKMTMKELDQYEIILPIKPDHKNEFINKIINSTCDDVRKEENRILFTGMFRGNYHSTMIENGFNYMSAWSNGYRDVYVSEKDHAIITYCEGDFSASLANTEQDYLNEFKTCDDFYKEY